jgi:hypothetical protein
VNTSRTLEQLDADPWPPASSDSTGLVVRCHRLRKVPLASLSAGDCRVLITQDIGTKHLVPLAVAFLEVEPLVEGDYYPGDLLVALMNVSGGFWAQRRDIHERMVAVAKRAAAELSARENPLGSEARLLKEVNEFIKQRDV